MGHRYVVTNKGHIIRARPGHELRIYEVPLPTPELMNRGVPSRDGKKLQ